MWFLVILGAALALGLSRRLGRLERHALACLSVVLVVVYAGLKSHAL